MADYIDNIVQVNISANSATPTLPGFGIPAIHAYHTHTTNVIDDFNDLSDMVSAGFSVYEPAYAVATSIVSQNPRPPVFKIIRGTTAVSQTFTFKVINHADGDVVGLSIKNPATGVVTSMHVTASSQSASQIATALALLVPSGVTAVASSVTVTFTVTTGGNIWLPSAMSGGEYTDTATSSSPQTDLAAAILIDPDFYGISLTQIGAASNADAATWVLANKRVMGITCADQACLAIASGNTGLMATTKAASNSRTYIQYSGSPATYGAAGAMAKQLTTDAGSATMAYKTIIGTAVDSLTPTQETNIQALNGNFYINIASVPVTVDGRSSSGQYMDITRGVDALTADIKVRVFTLMANSPKVPYTRKGISSIAAEVASSLQSFVNSGFISNDPGHQFLVSVPNIDDVSAADKSARILRNVNFTATAQGAIQTVIINGTISL